MTYIWALWNDDAMLFGIGLIPSRNLAVVPEPYIANVGMEGKKIHLEITQWSLQIAHSYRLLVTHSFLLLALIGGY